MISAIENFNLYWKNLPIDKKKNLRIEHNYKLLNGSMADIAIFKNDECLAIGKYFTKIILPTEENIRRYFHDFGGFIGCGTHSRLWFYYDTDIIVINDHKFHYPYDEKMIDISEFYNRLISNGDFGGN